MPEQKKNISLLYVTDPMCVWCYGFTPVVRRLQALWQQRLTVQVLVAGLNPYAEEPLSHQERKMLAVSWHQVQDRTQLPFDYSFFLRRNFVYDTEPPCRALLAAGHLRPALTLEVLRALHGAFYADGADITKTERLIRIVGMFGISENLFLTLFESEEIMQQTRNAFAMAQELGATRLPSIYLVTGNGPELLARGYCDLTELENELFRHLDRQ